MKLLGQSIPVRENLFFSLRRYTVWWVILLISMFFDALSTVAFVRELGVEREMNPLIRWLLRSLGLVPGLVIGKLLQLAAVAVFVSLDRRWGNLMLLIVIFLNCWAVVINTR